MSKKIDKYQKKDCSSLRYKNHFKLKTWNNVKDLLMNLSITSLHTRTINTAKIQYTIVMYVRFSKYVSKKSYWRGEQVLILEPKLKTVNNEISILLTHVIAKHSTIWPFPSFR